MGVAPSPGSATGWRRGLGSSPGLISFNQSLRRLVQSKLVALKDALGASDRPDELVLALRGITSGTSSRHQNPTANEE